MTKAPEPAARDAAPPKRRRRRWILVTLVLLGAFSLIASRVVMTSTRLTRQAQEAQTRQLRLDGMLRTLRADVWGAEGVEVTGDNVLKLICHGNKAVVWTRHPDGAITRNGAENQRWDGLGEAAGFERRAEGVVLRVGEDAAVLVSQVMLAERRGQ